MPESVAERDRPSPSSSPSCTCAQLSPSLLFLPPSKPAPPSLGTSGLLKPSLLDNGEPSTRDSTRRNWGLQGALASWGCRKAGLPSRWLGSTRRLSRKEKEVRPGDWSTGESGRGGREVTS